MSITWSWTGAVTPTSARHVARVTAGTAITLLVSTAPDISNPVTIGPEARDADDCVRFDLPGLDPGTRYYYVIAVDGVPDASSAGTFRTFDLDPPTIRVVHGSCQDHLASGDGPLWDRIMDRSPDLIVHLGDLGYANINTNDPALYHAAYDDELTAPRFLAALRSVASAYMWDDHDYGPNNSDKDSPGRPAALATYRQCVPHYPLHTADGGVWQSWSIGRVRFVLTDLRTDRDPMVTHLSQLGAEQKQWFYDELIDARDSGQIVVWFSTLSWRSIVGEGWRGYPTERAEIAEFISSNGIPLCIMSGDVHAIGIDDGTHTVGAIPEFTAAPFRRFASASAPDLAGPYSHGGLLTGGVENPNTISQYGYTEITDNGDDLTIAWSGWHVRDDGTEVLQASYTFKLGPRGVSEPGVAFVWDGAYWQPAVSLANSGAGLEPAVDYAATPR